MTTTENNSNSSNLIESSFNPFNGKYTLFSIIEALLKYPGKLVYELVHKGTARVSWFMFVLMVICVVLFGIIMGSFSGDQQLWVVPVKVLIGMILSGCICLPSLYIFSCLAGCNQDIKQIMGLFLQSLSLSGLLLIGFAPVTWLFSQATHSITFMGSLNLIVWFASIIIGIHLLVKSLQFLNKKGIDILIVWIIIFLLVIFQMSTLLRPLIGPYDGIKFHGKKFFLVHWFESKERR